MNTILKMRKTTSKIKMTLEMKPTRNNLKNEDNLKNKDVLKKKMTPNLSNLDFATRGKGGNKRGQASDGGGGIFTPKNWMCQINKKCVPYDLLTLECISEDLC